MIYDKLRYVKSLEENLSAAVNEKDPDKIWQIIEKIENEKLAVD